MKAQGIEGEHQSNLNGSKGEVLQSKVDPCAKCGKRVRANSVMCTKCGKSVHDRCEKMKMVSFNSGIRFCVNYVLIQ